MQTENLQATTQTTIPPLEPTLKGTMPTIQTAPLEVSIEQNRPPLPELTPELQKAMSELKIEDRNSIIYFGVSAQQELESISNKMIEGVKNKDTGGAGEVLNEMVSVIKGFDLEEFNPNKELSWWQKIVGSTKPLAKFIQQYEDVRDQIDMVSNNLEKHKSVLMTDVVSLERLYNANLEYFKKLELYIKAGDFKLSELDNRNIPEQQTKATTGEMIEVQNLNDLRSFRDDLERRVHDLRLSRQVAMQSLPSIRLIQENDKSLINKISSTLVNTVPLWRNQLAQTVTIFRSHESAKALKNASDLTNELLEKNAQGLRDANLEVRKQIERGIFDIESVKKANQTLIDTLNDSLRITQEGKDARAKALIELETTEKELKDALLSVKAKTETIQIKG